MSFFLDKILGQKNKSIEKKSNKIFFDSLLKLTKHHYKNCKKYKRILKSKECNLNKISSLEKIPFLPSKIFKDHMLLSVKRRDVIKILNSSGTSNNNLSQIALDRYTANMQKVILSRIISSRIGNKRLPTVFIESKSVLKNSEKYSARVAGILGFNNFSKDSIFILDDDMNLQKRIFLEFLKKYKNEKILFFGFTSLIWTNFLNKLEKEKLNLNLSNCILIHGGGWKKLINENISNLDFKNKINKILKIKDIINYYGMVEQTGSIFIECKKGFFHTSIFNDILIRDKNNLEVCKLYQAGIVQVFSSIPK